MKTAKPFGYPVTECGLPRDWCTVLPSGKENILDLSPQEVAKIYWLLESIHVDYAYSINGLRRQRNAVLNTHVEPANRIALDPVFYYDFFEENGMECSIELKLDAIGQPENFKGTLDIQLAVKEHDEHRRFILTCEDLQNYKLLAKHHFEFLDRPLSINLWTISTQWNGSIEYFRIRPEYYLIDESQPWYTPPPPPTFFDIKILP